MSGSAPQLTYWTEGLPCCNERWEAAYRRFETPAQERKKFRQRLEFLGAAQWPAEARILDLFCGSGTNLHALRDLGFENLTGVDLSPHLLEQYEGPAELIVGDATDLKFDDAQFDIAIVQGGLHHLPRIPEDLEKTVRHMHRVLKPTGRLVLVEPWLDRFLKFAHAAAFSPARKFWPKLDALAVMIEEERETYEQWLSQPEVVRGTLHQFFEPELETVRNGKLLFKGTPRHAPQP